MQHQQAVQEKQGVDVRLSKLLARYPDFIEWERVDLISTTPLRSQMHGLQAGGRTVGMLDVTLESIGQSLVLTLTPPAQGQDHPLLYWPTPLGTTALAALQLNPTAAAGSAAAALLRSLTPADLHMVRAACAAMADSLPADLPERPTWVQRLATLRQQLAQLPRVWRYDTVQLKLEQVHHDSEHLWFALGNPSYGARSWPSFEFRLSAANIKPGQFPHLPKLEFPQATASQPQFENWFEESQDHHGPKFELRFDTKSVAMDIGLWRALIPND